VTTLPSFFFVNNVFDKTLKVFVSGEHFQPSLTFASKAEPLTKWSLLNLSTPVIEQHTLKECKQLLEYQHLLIFRHVWWTPVLIRHLWQLKTSVFLHWILIRAVPFSQMFVGKARNLPYNGATERGLHLGKLLPYPQT